MMNGAAAYTVVSLPAQAVSGILSWSPDVITGQLSKPVCDHLS